MRNRAVGAAGTLIFVAVLAAGVLLPTRSMADNSNGAYQSALARLAACLKMQPKDLLANIPTRAACKNHCDDIVQRQVCGDCYEKCETLFPVTIPPNISCAQCSTLYAPGTPELAACNSLCGA